MSLEAMKAVLDHSKATTERMTLFMLAYRMSPDEGYASASIARLARDCGVNVDTIHRHIYHLQERGELIVVERPGKTNQYRVTLPGAVDADVLKAHPTPLQNIPPRKITPPHFNPPTPPQNAVIPPRKITPQKEVKEIENKYMVGFDLFWTAYPKKGRVAKAKCAEIWKRLKVNEEKLQTILAGLKDYATCSKVEQGYVLNATTYLNQRRWEDETDIAPAKQYGGNEV